MQIVKAKALKSFVGSFDGIASQTFTAGEVYEIPANTAKMFADGGLVGFDLAAEVEPDNSLIPAGAVTDDSDVVGSSEAPATTSPDGVTGATGEAGETPADANPPAANTATNPAGDAVEMTLADLKEKLGHTKQDDTKAELEKVGYADAKKGADVIPAEFVGKVLAANTATNPAA